MLSQNSLLRITDVYRIIESIDSQFFDTLKQLIDEKDNTYSYTKEQKNIIDNIKIFKKFCIDRKDDPLPVGIQMIESGIYIGDYFKNYIGYFEKHLEDLLKDKTNASIPRISLDILSVLLISIDGYKNTIDTFRNNSDYMFDKLTDITNIDNTILKLNSFFDSYKKQLSQLT